MNIVANQAVVNEARAQDAVRKLAPAMRELCEPQRAAMLALLAASAQVPIELVMLGTEGDDTECARLLDGRLERGHNRNEWNLGSGLGSFRVVMLPRERENQ
jgi:hypothetical protein